MALEKDTCKFNPWWVGGYGIEAWVEATFNRTMSGNKSPHKPPSDGSTWRNLSVPLRSLRRIKSQVFLYPLPSPILRPRPVKGSTRELRGTALLAAVLFPRKVLLFAGDYVPRGSETCEPGEGGFQSCTTQEHLFPGVQGRIEYNVNYCFNSKPVFRPQML